VLNGDIEELRRRRTLYQILGNHGQGLRAVIDTAIAAYRRELARVWEKEKKRPRQAEGASEGGGDLE
jgi:hypothetical protein